MSGVAVAADALVNSEREQLEGFVEVATDGALSDRLDGTLGFVDPAAVPVRLVQGADAQEFTDRNELAEAVRGALGVFDSSKQELLQQAVTVDGERATVTTRMGDSAYEQTVIYDLVRKGERWLVRRVRTL
ncbi:MAG TPA: hypothetical protein VFX59_20520 [Polyangiales bacterium]|nr:hypothetical protein [Polyangiales bacterium]